MGTKSFKVNESLKVNLLFWKSSYLLNAVVNIFVNVYYSFDIIIRRYIHIELLGSEIVYDMTVWFHRQGLDYVRTRP